jgi:hypothetical protein
MMTCSGPETQDRRGKLLKAGGNRYSRRAFDILAAFLDVLGKPVRQAPENYERGELLMDSAVDLETNASLELTRENSLLLPRGPLADDATVKNGPGVSLGHR